MAKEDFRSLEIEDWWVSEIHENEERELVGAVWSAVGKITGTDFLNESRAGDRIQPISFLTPDDSPRVAVRLAAVCRLINSSKHRSGLSKAEAPIAHLSIQETLYGSVFRGAKEIRPWQRTEFTFDGSASDPLTMTRHVGL